MAKKAVPSVSYRLAGAYDRLRRSLLELPDDGRLDKTLAYWVLPTDRRLPIAFLEDTLRDLLKRPLDELMSTPGVGQKKILGFFDLLRRAAKAAEVDPAFGLPTQPNQGTGPFDPAAVSEAVWATWCETVNHHGFREEKLGRLAPSLQALPTVIWDKPLASYSDRSLAEIRTLKTHGQKRVEAILEVFCIVHEAASTAVLPENIDLRLAPTFVPPVTNWLVNAFRQAAPLSAEETRERLIAPLTRQVEIDLGATVGGLVHDRFLPPRHAPTVKQQADDLGVTRARIYQLFDDCSRVMEVRWPEGRLLLSAAANQMRRFHSDTLPLVESLRELFFPEDLPATSSHGGKSPAADC